MFVSNDLHLDNQARRPNGYWTCNTSSKTPVEIVVSTTSTNFTIYHDSTILCSALEITLQSVKSYAIDNASTIRADLKWRSHCDSEEMLRNIWTLMPFYYNLKWV